MSLNRIRLLLSPSLLSGLVVGGLTIFVLAANAWIYIDDNKYFYNFFFGSNGIVTALLHTPSDIFSLVRTIFAGATVYYVLLVLAGLVSAVIVYESLVAIARVQREVQDFETEVTSGGLTYRQALAERLHVWGVRLVCGAVWALYWLVFLRVLLPFGIVVLQNGIDTIATGTPGGWFGVFVSGIFVAASLHMHVICGRLVSLRLRVFSA